MTACPDIDPLLAERASGDLPSDDAARLEAHLDGCPRCRREMSAYAELFERARMPERSPLERAIGDLGPPILAAWKRRHRRRVAGFALGAGVAAAAAAAAIALFPAFAHRGLRPAAPEAAVASSSSSWEPDVDGALAVADALAGGNSYAAGTTDGTYAETTEDVVLAAFDEADGY